MHILENNKLRVAISPKGAELKSIKKDGIEYLWQLDPRIWERQAPLLFPLIGRLKDGEYVHKGRTYRTDIHGFARFMDFETLKSSDEFISLRICSNKRTETEYPFHFSLTINYRLEGSRIIKEHITENTGREVMFYEIGGHEGYNLALFDGEAMEDYYVNFPGMKYLETFTGDENVMINSEKRKVHLNDGKLFLSPEVFRNDALIMDEFSERKIIMANKKNDKKVTLWFDDFKYLGVWTKYMRSNYICLEPWSSLPDCNYIGKELTEKIDIRKLEAGRKEKLKYTIGIE